MRRAGDRPAIQAGEENQRRDYAVHNMRPRVGHEGDQMKDVLKRFAAFIIQAAIGLCILAMIVVFMLDYTAGCGQTYIDSQGAVHPVATNDQCIAIKHHGKE